MDTESKVADLSEQTNHMSVLHAESVTLSKPIGKKAESKELEEVEEDDRERKKRRKVRNCNVFTVLRVLIASYCSIVVTGEQGQR